MVSPMPRLRVCTRTLAALALILATIASAQTTSPAVKNEPADALTKPASAAPDFSKEALVFDQMLTRIHLDADGTGTRETTVRVRVLADAGVKAMAVLAFTYTASNQQVDIGYVRVLKPDGSTVVTPDYNAQDLPADVTREAPMYSDIHQKHVAVRGLGVGDTLEYQVTERTLKPEVPGQFWLDYDFQKNLICLDEQLDIDLPADKTVTVASANLQPAITTASGRKLYHWTSKNLARPDPDAPPKSTKHLKPDVQVTTFTSWQQIGEWYQSLQKNAVVVTPAIQAKADALTKGLNSDDDKLRAIFNDVALHIHYIGLDFGIGRYQPHSADDVLANEYGDCKDKHTLLAALLKAAGIESWPVLISTSRDLDPATPSPAQFDHVITLVPLNGKLLWMDSTEELAPIGTLAGVLRDKQALAIPIAKPPYLENTPADLPYAQSTTFTVRGKLSDQGVFTGHFDETFHGDVEILLRAAFRATPQSQWKVLVQNFSNATGFAGEVQTPDVSPVEQTAVPLHFSFDYSREKYGDWDNHRISPPLPPVGWELAPGIKQIKPADDIDAGSPGDQDFRASVELPAGWHVFPPANVDLKEDWAEYHSTYAFKDGSYTAERRLVVHKDKIPLTDWDKYLTFRRAIYDDESHMTPLLNPSTMSGGSMHFDGTPFENIDIVREKMNETVKPVRDATTILAAIPASSPADMTHAMEICRTLVADNEIKSLDLARDDPYSLYYAQALASSWTCLGWAEIDAREVGAAEIYLRPAWRLSLSRIAGYQLARALEAKGSKVEAAHIYELASIAGVDNLFDAALPPSFDLRAKIAEGYKRVTGKELAASSLNRGQYTGSLRAELDSIQDIRPLTRASKLTGAGLYIVSFESGKPVKAIMMQGDPGFGIMEATLQAHTFPPELPAGSKARLLREVRVICTPWAGCDAYMLLPTAIEMPSQVIHFTPTGTSKDGKVIKLEVQQP